MLPSHTSRPALTPLLPYNLAIQDRQHFRILTEGGVAADFKGCILQMQSGTCTSLGPYIRGRITCVGSSTSQPQYCGERMGRTHSAGQGSTFVSECGLVAAEFGAWYPRFAVWDMHTPWDRYQKDMYVLLDKRLRSYSANVLWRAYGPTHFGGPSGTFTGLHPACVLSAHFDAHIISCSRINTCEIVYHSPSFSEESVEVAFDPRVKGLYPYCKARALQTLSLCIHN